MDSSPPNPSTSQPQPTKKGKRGPYNQWTRHESAATQFEVPIIPRTTLWRLKKKSKENELESSIYVEEEMLAMDAADLPIHRSLLEDGESTNGIDNALQGNHNPGNLDKSTDSDTGSESECSESSRVIIVL